MTGPLYQQAMPTDPREILQLPPQFHFEDIQYMMSQISRGEFCSLIGLGSVGKSTLIKMLPRWDVKTLHFKQWAPYFVNIVLDPHLFVMLNKNARTQVGDMWMGYELMLSQLQTQIVDIEKDLLENNMQESLSIYFPQGIADLKKGVQRLYGELFKGDDLYKQAGIRHLQQAIYEVLWRNPNIRITFVFDEIEEFFNKLPPEFFQSLRGLRDMYKGRVMYITTSRAPLKQLAQKRYDPKDEEINYKVLESFVELFDGQTRYVSPLDNESIQITLKRLEARSGYRLQRNDAMQDLVQLSGAHAGLLRRSYKIAARYNTTYNRQNFINDLLSEKGVTNQCESIFLSLSEDEREAVKMIANRQALNNVPAHVLKDLAHKHIIHQPTPNQYTPIFVIFDIWVKQRYPI